MAKTVLRLDKRRQLNDGTYPVQISVGYGTGLYLSTGVYVAADEWSQDARQCVGKNAKHLNAILSGQLARIQARVYDLRARGVWDTYTLAQLRQMLEDLALERPTVGELTLGAMLDMYAERIRSKGSACIFRSIRLRLEKHIDTHSLGLSSLGKADARRFVEWVTEGTSPNTARTYVSTLRTVWNMGLDEEIVHVDIFRGVKMPRGEETPTPTLSPDQLRAFRAADGRRMKKRQREVRDLMLLSLYLCGINLIDLQALTPRNVVAGRIEYRRSKTGRLYSVKIEPEVREILDRYPPRDGRLVGTAYISSAAMLYRARDVVGDDGEPVAPQITWYWMRYTWASTASFLDIPEDVISRALGHQHTTGAPVTRSYISFDRRKIDDANRRVLDYLLYGKQ